MSNIKAVLPDAIITPEKRSAIVWFIAEKGNQVPIPPWWDTTRLLKPLNNPPNSLQIFHGNDPKVIQNLKWMTVSWRYFMDASTINYSEIPHNTWIHTLTFRVEQVQDRIHEDLKRILYLLWKNQQIDDGIKSRITTAYGLVGTHKQDRYLWLSSDVNGSRFINGDNPLGLFLTELSGMFWKSDHFQRQVDWLIYRLWEKSYTK